MRLPNVMDMWRRTARDERVSLSAGSHPHCRIVVRGGAIWAIDQVLDAFAQRRFELLTPTRANPLEFRVPRWTAGRLAWEMLDDGIPVPPAGHTKVIWQPIPPNEVLLSFEHDVPFYDTTEDHSTAFVDTISDLVSRFAYLGVLAFASPILRKRKDTSHLSTNYANAVGYRGERGPDGLPLPWVPFPNNPKVR